MPLDESELADFRFTAVLQSAFDYYEMAAASHAVPFTLYGRIKSAESSYFRYILYDISFTRRRATSPHTKQLAASTALFACAPMHATIYGFSDDDCA